MLLQVTAGVNIVCLSGCGGMGSDTLFYFYLKNVVHLKSVPACHSSTHVVQASRLQRLIKFIFSIRIET